MWLFLLITSQQPNTILNNNHRKVVCQILVIKLQLTHQETLFSKTTRHVSIISVMMPKVCGKYFVGIA